MVWFIIFIAFGKTSKHFAILKTSLQISLKFVAFVQDIAKNPGLVDDTVKLVGAPGAFIVESTPESWL